MNHFPKTKIPKTKFAAILASLPHPIIVVRRDRAIIYANFAAEEFFFQSVEMLKTCKFEDIIPFGSPLIGLVEQVFQSGSTINEYAIDLGTPRTTKKLMVDVQVALVSHAGEDEAVLMIQKKSIASTIDRQLTHRGAARSVSGMAAMLAHEIKNPLASIRGAAQLLEADLDASERTLTQLICNETDRVVRLVDQFEVFTDTPQLLMQEVNIHTVLTYVAQLARRGFGKNISIKEDYDPSLPSLLGNKDKLIQVFLNLMKNAAEAVDQKNGEITLKTSFRPGVRLAIAGQGRHVSLPLEFCVIDNGGGIAEDIKNIIFEPFVTSKSGGTGLGLALVAKIIEDHGGVIECDTEMKAQTKAETGIETGGEQTIFRILMPISQQGITSTMNEPIAQTKEVNL